MIIDWNSAESHILLNPRLPSSDLVRAFEVLPKSGEFSSHLWLATSGSTKKNPTETKYVALSKQAFLESAKAVNEHLQAQPEDVWINPLPMFHVGGIGIHARAFLKQSKVFPFEGRWNCQNYVAAIQKNKGTLSALVPAQLYDLVAAKIPCPSSLRAVIIGGGHLSDSLYFRAADLGWKVLPSYGMTETASQIATALISSNGQKYPDLQLLPHLTVKADFDGCLCVKGSSLFSSFAFISSSSCRIIDLKEERWFKTEDRGNVSSGSLFLYGRNADFVKIGGESVNTLKLEAVLDLLKVEMGIAQDVALIAVPSERLGHEIHLAVEGDKSASIDLLQNAFALQVAPFEKIRCIHSLEFLPRSPLKKLLRAELLAMILK